MKNIKKKILVTGGTGFIGSSIVNLLLTMKKEVVVYDNNFRGKIKRLALNQKKIKLIKGDIRDLKKLEKASIGIDTIIHLAYINGTKYFYTKPDLVLDVAIKGMINIIEISKKNKIKNLFLASSSEVYQTPTKIPTDENESLKIPYIFNPRYSYGGGKILSELMSIHLGKKVFNKIIIFRPHNVYGPDMGQEHVVPELISKIGAINKKNNKFYIEGSGNEIRSFIHIEDFTRAFKIIYEKGKHLNIYNIGTKEKIKIIDLAKLILKIIQKPIKIYKKPLKTGGTKIRVPDIKKIVNLGFKQEISIEQGIRKILFGN